MDKIKQLQNEISTAAGPQKVAALNKLAGEYQKSDQKLAEQTANEAKDLATELNDNFGLGHSHYILGRIQHSLTNYNTAAKWYQKALGFFKYTESDFYTAACYNNLGAINETQGNFKMALEYYFKTIPIWEKLDDHLHLANTLNNLGIVYEKDHDYDRALEYHHKALHIWEKEPESLQLAGSYNNIGIVYEKQEAHSEALVYYLKSLKIKEKFDDKRSLAITYLNAGNSYVNLENFSKASTYLMDSLEIFKELDEKYGLAVVQNSIARIQSSQGENAKALKLLKENLELIQENGLRDQEYSCMEYIGEIYEKRDDYKVALNWYKKSVKLQQELFSEEKSRQVAEMQAKFDLESKEREAEIYRLKNIELAEAYKQVEQLARRDGLTGLPNRRDMLEALESEMKRQRRSGKISTIIISDLDKFKQTNDQFGHLAGDYVLKEVGQLLINNLRGQDKVCRWGGEEFLFLLPETELSGGLKVAENLRNKLDTYQFNYKEQQIPVTMTFGVTELKSGADLESILKQADGALYYGKAKGRNQVTSAIDRHAKTKRGLQESDTIFESHGQTHQQEYLD